MNKFIVSSKILCIYLLRCSYELDDESNIVLKVEKELFRIKGIKSRPISVHFIEKYNKEPYERDIAYDKIERLIKVLKSIEEQTIVLSFDGPFISIREIDI